MAGDGEKELSEQDLSVRMSSMDGRFGTLEASLQNLQQAFEGLTLHLNNGNNFTDGLHLGGSGVRQPRHPPPCNPQTPPVYPPQNQPPTTKWTMVTNLNGHGMITCRAKKREIDLMVEVGVEATTLVTTITNKADIIRTKTIG
uniref:Uncharacterized protein n=1 Tax=Asparagus officinalis TaxID=4686 RepID=Q2XNZ2_ASPOF|nr:hypothetical protein 10.t00020 [Asparagus officinalis]